MIQRCPLRRGPQRPGLLCLLSLLLTWPVAASAAKPLDGVLSVELEWGVPFHASDQNLGRRPLPLTVDITFRDGKARQRAWAYIPATPALEHEATITKAEVSDEAIHLEFDVTFKNDIPRYLGGSGSYVVHLQRLGTMIEGTYEGKTHAYSSPRETLMKDKQRFWIRLGGKTAEQWRGHVSSGHVTSYTHVTTEGWGNAKNRKIVATAVLHPHPRSVAGHVAVKAQEHPRLLVRASEVDALRKRAASDDKAMVDAIRRTLSSGDTGNAAPGVKRQCAGFEAAGYATLYLLQGDKADADRAADAANRAMQRLGATTGADFARELAGLAVAYDHACNGWTDAQRREVRDALFNRAWPMLAVEEYDSIAESPFASGGVIGVVHGAHDHRLATIRAAAGIALLAIDRDDQIDHDRTQLGLTIVERSLRRWSRAAIGSNGSGNGNYGFDEALEMALPFYLVFANAVGRDLTADVNIAKAPLWGMFTRGLAFNQQGTFVSGYWLPFGFPLMDDADRAVAAWYLNQHPYQPANPFHAAVALATLRRNIGPQPPTKRRLVQIDDRMGAYVMRSGWNDASDFVTIFEFGRGASSADALRSHFSVYGLGREWIHRHHEPFGSFKWPDHEDLNVMQVNEALTVPQGDAVPQGDGYLGRIRASRDGSASVSMHSGGYASAENDSSEDEQLEGSKSYRTLGVDYSKRSGADALVVLVDSTTGVRKRQRVWEVNLGDIPASQVKIEGPTFLVKPSDTKATMAGSVLFPETMKIEYIPPKDGKSGRLRIHVPKPGKSTTAMLESSIEQGTAASGDPDALELPDEFKIDLNKGKYDWSSHRNAARRVAKFLYKYTSSTKMGGGDRGPKVAGSVVVVLTIQNGPPPKVEALADLEGDAFIQVGPQKVRWAEWLVKF